MQELILSNGQTYELTEHAVTRIAQRNLTPDDLVFVLENGGRFHRAGGIFFYLRRCDIPSQSLSDSSVARLEGTAIFVDRDGGTATLITAYRGANLRDIKRKKCYDMRQLSC